jgi:hypothetical protein
MAKLHDEWQILPHGPLTEVDPGLLTVVGTIPMPLGNFPRRMTVVGLGGNKTAIFSPIALREECMAEIERLGAPSYLIVPNGFHRLDAKPWKKRYPSIAVVCPPGARQRVEQAVAVDATTDVLRDKAVKLVLVKGTRESEYALLVRGARGTTLVVNDVIANVRQPPGRGAYIMARLFGFGVKHPQIPREVKWLFLKDKAALAAQLREWAAMSDLQRIIPSHGDIIDRPARVLGRLAEGLSG